MHLPLEIAGHISTSGTRAVVLASFGCETDKGCIRTNWPDTVGVITLPLRGGWIQQLLVEKVQEKTFLVVFVFAKASRILAPVQNPFFNTLENTFPMC